MNPPVKPALKNKPELLPLGAAVFASLFGTTGHLAAETDPVLPTVTVETTAEPVESYQAQKTRVGKIAQDPHDIPQAVTTVTHKLLEEQQVGSLREALRNVSGLTFNAAEGGRSGDNMMLRGFYTFGDIYLDGIRDTAQYNRETFNLEQVDVLRGSAAMLFGRGQAGGVINQVSKTPQLKDQYKLTGSLGTEHYGEATADLNKRLGETSAIRANIMHRDEGSWRSNPSTGDEPELHREGVALSAGFGLGTDNELVLSHVLTTTEDKPDYGISFDPATREPGTIFPADYYWGTARNFDESETNVTTATYTHYFSPKSEWRTQLRAGDYERSYWARTPNLTQAPNEGGIVVGNNNTLNAGPTRTLDYETVTLQSDFSTQFTALGMKHQFLVGGEYLGEDSFRHSLQNLGGTTLDNPPLFKPYLANTTGNPVRFDSDSYALYLQDTVEFIPQWKATLGVRRDELDAQFSSATSPALEYGEWSTRTALSYHPQAESHYYVSYSDSFSPTADLYQLTVKPQPPERSEVIELGSKWLLFDGNLALRAALYRAEKEWERNSDLESTAAILTKKRRTDGLELEVAGRVNEHWEIFAGFALMDATILEVAENINATTGVITVGNPGYKGQDARNTPPYTFNLWSTYSFGNGWKLGGGVEAKGERYGFNPSGAGAIPTLPDSTEFHPNTAPSYQRWDAMVAYEQKQWAVRLNAQNLFDELYYDSLYDNGGFTVPGLGRRFIVTTEVKF